MDLWRLIHVALVPIDAAVYDSKHANSSQHKVINNPGVLGGVLFCEKGTASWKTQMQWYLDRKEESDRS